MKKTQYATMIPFITGIVFPLVIYKIRGIFVYIRTITRDENKYGAMPKYAEVYKKIHKVQSQLSPYYQNLSVSGKRKYINRVVYNLTRIEFEGAEGETVTLEKKIVIIGALVQLMFGLKQFILPKFTGVRLYPQFFYSRFLQSDILGLTVPRKGFIALSWKDTLNGVLIPDDNRHLALHEWAHAFYFDHQKNIGKPFFRNLNRQLNNIKHKYKLLQINRNDYLREYGNTNTHEFFSVSLECFFENPEELKKAIPNLFDILCKLLNQNPINLKNDYQLTGDEKDFQRRR